MNRLRSLYCQGCELSSGGLLGAEVHDVEDKRRCLNAVLDQDPDNGAATRALLVLTRKGQRARLSPVADCEPPLLALESV